MNGRGRGRGFGVNGKGQGRITRWHHFAILPRPFRFKTRRNRDHIAYVTVHGVPDYVGGFGEFLWKIEIDPSFIEI